MKYLQWILASIMMCFRVWDKPGGGGGAAVADPPDGKTKDFKPEDIPKAPEEFTMEEIKGIMAEVVKDNTKEELEQLKKDIHDVQRKSVFPDFDNGETEAGGSSVVDTRFFYKNYGGRPSEGDMKFAAVHPSLPYGMAMGRDLLQIGGPFKRLSPEMETFAKIVKCRGNINKSREVGVDIQGHNEKVTEHMKQAGMNEGVLAQGGALVPVEYMATVIEFATAQSIILSKVWRMNMSSNILRIPRLVQAAGSYFGGITLYSPDEGGEKTADNPTLERLELEAKKLIGLIYLTDELIADSMINVINYVTGLFTRAFQYDLENRVINNTGAAGAGPCLGIVQDPNVNVVARNNAGAIDYDDVLRLDAEIDENFTNLTWMTRKKTQIALMRIVDLNNRPLFVTNYEAWTGASTNPPTMMTYPVYKTRNIPELGNQGDLILGDLSWYLLAMRQDLTVDSSMHVRFVYDEECLRFVMRLDGMPAISIAFAILGDVES